MPEVPVPQDALDDAICARNAALAGAGAAHPERAMADAIQAALKAMGFEPRWSVPCLDRDECRTIHHTRESAEEHAAKEGPNAVIESRLEQPWRLT